MKVLVISDTHRRLANLEKLMSKLGKVDMVLHCGDVEGEEDLVRNIVGCPVHFVAGNCDYNGESPLDKLVDIEGHKIFMTHGHRMCVGASLEYLASSAVLNKAEIAFYGHLHLPRMDELAGVIIASPGSLSEPRQQDRKPSYILMNIIQDKAPELELCYM